MSSKPRPSALAHQARAPRACSRAGRIELVGEAARDLAEGRLPNQEAATFLSSALLAWLERGGNMEKDYFSITRPKSHATPQRVWRQLEAERHRRLIDDERQHPAGAGTVASSASEKSEQDK